MTIADPHMSIQLKQNDRDPVKVNNLLLLFTLVLVGAGLYVLSETEDEPVAGYETELCTGLGYIFENMEAMDEYNDADNGWECEI